MLKNRKLTLCYDGTDYHGWQRQENAVTVQQELEEAIAKIVKAPVSVVGCSRTDAGVHAKEYVCHFRADSSVPDEKMPYALNALLGRGISVLSCEECAEEFHARFDTVGKEYCYRIYNAPHRDPFAERYSWHVPYALSFEKMKRAAEDLVGTYDCTVFEAAGADTKGSRVRTIYRCELTREERMICMRICANGYLYNMVRIMAGTLFSVGVGKLEADGIPSLIRSRDRKRAGMTAPPQGLCLTRVFYREEELF